jgi:hypothetical protein
MGNCFRAAYFCQVLLSITSTACSAEVPLPRHREPAPLSATIGSEYAWIERYQGALPGKSASHPMNIAAEPFGGSVYTGEVLEAILDEIDKPVPTKFTHRGLYAITRLMQPHLEAAVPSVRHLIGRRLTGRHVLPVTSTLPIPSIAATSLPVPMGKSPYAIMLSEGLSRSSNRFAEIILRAAHFEQVSVGRWEVAALGPPPDEATARFLAATFMQIALTDPTFLQDHRLDSGVETWAGRSELSLALILFVLSHEYAHVLLAHDREGDIQDIWREELEADYVGTYLYFAALARMAKSNEVFSSQGHWVWIGVPIMYVELQSDSEAVLSVLNGQAQRHRLTPEGRKTVQAFADHVVNGVAKRGRARRPQLNVVDPEPYPSEAARAHVVKRAIAEHLKRSRGITAKDRCNARLGILLAERLRHVRSRAVPHINEYLRIVP